MQYPVCQYFAHTLDAAEKVLGDDAMIALVRELRQQQHELRWTQNPNYVAHEPTPGFLQNYAYAEIIGAKGTLLSKNLLLGVMLLGPHTLYPTHEHPASEVYVVLAGNANWQRDGGEWVLHPPNQPIYHAPWVRHATQTQAEPLLALYIWWGQIEQAASISRV